ncbi:hypothetical protein BOTCAL_0221g00040 [Botryotinia calthae]|uniref:F-box domain-containing protein n=1 Tax=Botryotinia calthae TaxID=38488 RepID=A0A4Y8CY48_9HELO|nr:hypothetical protein BOTCAL_0221g00040 [Botryotinia calthae]
MNAQRKKEVSDLLTKLLATPTILHDKRGSAKVKYLPFVKTIIKQPITPRQSSAGIFDTFPLEIRQEICKHLDFKSIVKFSQTSYAAKIIVDSLLLLTEITSKIPQFLKAIAQLGLLHVHSIATIAQVLNSSSCDFCPNFGSYFFPLTGSRCCFFCLSTELEFSLLRKDQAIEHFDLSSIEGLPSVIVKKFCLGTQTRMTELAECVSAQKVIDMYDSRRHKTIQHDTASEDQFQHPQHGLCWMRQARCESSYAAAVAIPLLRDSMWHRYSGGYYCTPCIRSWEGTNPSYGHIFFPLCTVIPRVENGPTKEFLYGGLNIPARTMDEHLEHTKTCAKAQIARRQQQDLNS